jgi:hypothetical protein
MNIAFVATPRLAGNNPYRDRRVARKEKPMCPVCIATAALIAGKVTSSAGAATIAIRKLGGKYAADNPVRLHLNRPEPKER